jgi:hypothetical protein
VARGSIGSACGTDLHGVRGCVGHAGVHRARGSDACLARSVH